MGSLSVIQKGINDSLNKIQRADVYVSVWRIRQKQGMV